VAVAVVIAATTAVIARRPVAAAAVIAATTAAIARRLVAAAVVIAARRVVPAVAQPPVAAAAVIAATTAAIARRLVAAPLSDGPVAPTGRSGVLRTRIDPRLGHPGRLRSGSTRVEPALRIQRPRPPTVTSVP
jgi:hypothetical protein